MALQEIRLAAESFFAQRDHARGTWIPVTATVVGLAVLGLLAIGALALSRGRRGAASQAPAAARMAS